MRSSLEDHLAACAFHRCPQQLHGCTYSGTQEELATHQPGCVHAPTHHSRTDGAGADYGDSYDDDDDDDDDDGGGGGGGGGGGMFDELSSSTASAATLRAARDSPDASAAASAAAASVTARIMESHDLQVEALVGDT